VHQVRSTQLGAKVDRGAQDVDAPLPHRAIGAGDRQAGRRSQQPVQAAYLETVVGRDPADLGALGGRHAPPIVAKGERRQFQSAVAKARRQRTLTFEGKLADHLVAERQLH
jgi:hypothetical protein